MYHVMSWKRLPVAERKDMTTRVTVISVPELIGADERRTPLGHAKLEFC